MSTDHVPPAATPPAAPASRSTVYRVAARLGAASACATPGAPTLTRRACLAALLTARLTARAVPREERPYEAAAFEAALAAGGGVVLAFMVDWCSSCGLQKAVVAELLELPRFAALTFFVADFDQERALKRRLRIVRQGSFVVFKGGREVARATGVTERKALEALFAQAL